MGKAVSMTTVVLDRILADIVGRILNVVKPRQVFLFGSAAHGHMHDNSDLDLLVVVPNGLHRRKTAQSIYRNLVGVGHAADIVVVTEDDVKRSHEGDGYVIWSALTEGRLVYAA
jgi:predicted nucleotidyltransferase